MRQQADELAVHLSTRRVSAAYKKAFFTLAFVVVAFMATFAFVYTFVSRADRRGLHEAFDAEQSKQLSGAPLKARSDSYKWVLDVVMEMYPLKPAQRRRLEELIKEANMPEHSTVWDAKDDPKEEKKNK